MREHEACVANRAAWTARIEADEAVIRAAGDGGGLAAGAQGRADAAAEVLGRGAEVTTGMFKRSSRLGGDVRLTHECRAYAPKWARRSAGPAWPPWR